MGHLSTDEYIPSVKNWLPSVLRIRHDRPHTIIGADSEVVFHWLNFGFRVAGMGLTPPLLLTIAGFDPASGAGITADIKTIAAHECYGVSCITALTVQSTQGVRRVEGVDPKIIVETLGELVSDLAVDAVHIGMLGNAQVVEAVASFLGQIFPGRAK